MQINDTFQMLFGTATVVGGAFTDVGTVRVEFRYPGDLPTDGTGIKTFTLEDARSVGLIG